MSRAVLISPLVSFPVLEQMRSVWGVAEDEPLPGPEKGGPDWSKGSKHPDNVKVSSLATACGLILMDNIPFRGVSNQFQEEIAGAVFHQLLTDRTIVIPESQRNLQAAKVRYVRFWLSFSLTCA